MSENTTTTVANVIDGAIAAIAGAQKASASVSRAKKALREREDSLGAEVTRVRDAIHAVYNGVDESGVLLWHAERNAAGERYSSASALLAERVACKAGFKHDRAVRDAIVTTMTDNGASVRECSIVSGASVGTVAGIRERHAGLSADEQAKKDAKAAASSALSAVKKLADGLAGALDVETRVELAVELESLSAILADAARAARDARRAELAAELAALDAEAASA